MNWNEPDGAKITLDLFRLKASDPATRQGSLFVNPGGPGGDASSLCIAQATSRRLFSATLESHFDILCPDPRGIGKSTRVQCDEDLWNQRPSLFVETPEEWDELVKFNQDLGQSCVEGTGPLLEFVDTTNAAKDLEAIRVALGEEKLNWLGFSYGTQLGAAYAELFPQTVGQMILDGAVDHSQQGMEGFVFTSWAIEDELNRFFAWCDANSTCALHGNTSSADVFDEMITAANEKPILTPACAPNATTSSAGQCRESVTGYDIIANLVDRFQNPGNWANAAAVIKQAVDGNATMLANGVPQASGFSDFASLAVGCLDWGFNATTFETHVAMQNLAKAMFPHTMGSGQFWQYATQCVGWPYAPTNPQHWLDQEKMAQTPEILIVNAEHDPATPIAWAHGLQRQVPNSVLLTRDGDGHTSYTTSMEAQAIMDAFLVNGTLPEENLIIH